jgi:putative ABC transport system permease protein
MGSLLRIALRNVARNTRRSLITGAAIFLGIGALVGVGGFMKGFDDAIVANMAEGRLGALSLHHPRYLASEEQAPLGLSLPGDPAFLSRLSAVPGVKAVAPRLVFSAAVSVGEETGFASVLGVDPAREPRALPRAAEGIVEGRPVAAPGEAVLGAELARSLRARLGDTVTFLAPDKDGVLNAVEAKLVGLLAYKTPGDKRVAQLALLDADGLLRMEGRVSEIAVAVTGPAEGAPLLAVRDRLQAAVGSEAKVTTWSEIASWLTDLLVYQKVMLLVVGAVFVIVVLTGITNTMLMSVLERVREIGTLMALGARRREIAVLFLAESGFLGLLGGLAGALAGSAVTFWLNRRGIDLPPPGLAVHNFVRPSVTVAHNVLAVLLATAGATASAVYPAVKASRMRPVEALSHV